MHNDDSGSNASSTKCSPLDRQAKSHDDLHDQEPAVGSLIDVESIDTTPTAVVPIKHPLPIIAEAASIDPSSAMIDPILVTSTAAATDTDRNDVTKPQIGPAGENPDTSSLASQPEPHSLKITTPDLAETDRLRSKNAELEQTIDELKKRLTEDKCELEREVQRRVELEQRFTEEAKRTTDQIEELIAKSDLDDAKFSELKRKFDLYTRETSSMIESFTTNRELLASQLIELRQENDHLLGKYLNKASDLQSADIDLPQSVEELQFHCLTLNEKLILTTLAKERLEETLVQHSRGATETTSSSTSPAPAPATRSS